MGEFSIDVPSQGRRPSEGAVPKLRVPFEVVQVAGRKRGRIIEQDSDREVLQCAYAIVATEKGSRVEEPEFGITDQAFRARADLDEMRDALDEWDGRIKADGDAELIDLIDRVDMRV